MCRKKSSETILPSFISHRASNYGKISFTGGGDVGVKADCIKKDLGL